MRPLFFKNMRTSIYIDGFNLYYRVKGTDYKWLDLMALCQNLLDRQHAIDTINYYTTKVEGRQKRSEKTGATRHILASITKIYPATPDKAWAFPATQSNDAKSR